MGRVTGRLLVNLVFQVLTLSPCQVKLSTVGWCRGSLAFAFGLIAMIQLCSNELVL